MALLWWKAILAVSGEGEGFQSHCIAEFLSPTLRISVIWLSSHGKPVKMLRELFVFPPWSLPHNGHLEKKSIQQASSIYPPNVKLKARALVDMVFSEHLLFGMIQTVGEDLLSYRAHPHKVTQTTRKLRAICYEEEQFPFPAPSFLGSYLLGFLYPRQTRIGCRLFPLGNVAAIGNYQGCFLVSRGRRQCEVSSWLAQPCPVQKVLVVFMVQGEGEGLPLGRILDWRTCTACPCQEPVLRNHQLSTASTFYSQVSNWLSVDHSKDTFHSYPASDTNLTPGAQGGDRSETLMCAF